MISSKSSDAHTPVERAVTRAALYARVSTEDQREHQTIDGQLHALRNFAPHANIAIVDEYVDDRFPALSQWIEGRRGPASGRRSSQEV